MSTPAGWYTQPDGQQMYWNGQKYLAAWAPELGAVMAPAGSSGPETVKEMRMPQTQVAAKGFFASLFDFGFTSFITLKLLSGVYGLLVVLTLVAGVFLVVMGISRGGMYAVGAIVVVPVVTLIYLVLVRVSMEMVALFFRIGENTTLMAASAGGADRPVEVIRTRRDVSYSGLDGPY